MGKTVKVEPEPTLAALQESVNQFAIARDWLRFHNPRNVAVAIMIEAAELLECFQWRTDAACSLESLDSELKRAIESELADVLIYSLNLANALDVGAADLIRSKLGENEDRFPPSK